MKTNKMNLNELELVSGGQLIQDGSVLPIVAEVCGNGTQKTGGVMVTAIKDTVSVFSALYNWVSGN